mmetsp:Transcript_105382/g.250914  ORF Transcript_105382/g.250914 Transcript_105382/m.250914 type:complete len:372 (+) Transcript_105382:2308-3423(+)
MRNTSVVLPLVLREVSVHSLALLHMVGIAALHLVVGQRQVRQGVASGLHSQGVWREVPDILLVLPLHVQLRHLVQGQVPLRFVLHQLALAVLDLPHRVQIRVQGAVLSRLQICGSPFGLPATFEAQDVERVQMGQGHLARCHALVVHGPQRLGHRLLQGHLAIAMEEVMSELAIVDLPHAGELAIPEGLALGLRVVLFPSQLPVAVALAIQPIPFVDGSGVVRHVLIASKELALAVVEVVLPLALVGLAIRPALDTHAHAHVHAVQCWMVRTAAVVEAHKLLRRVHVAVLDHLLPHLQVLGHHRDLQVLEAWVRLPIRCEALLNRAPLRRVLEVRVNLEPHGEAFLAACSTGGVNADLLDEGQRDSELHQV